MMELLIMLVAIGVGAWLVLNWADAVERIVEWWKG